MDWSARNASDAKKIVVYFGHIIVEPAVCSYVRSNAYNSTPVALEIRRRKPFSIFDVLEYVAHLPPTKLRLPSKTSHTS
jgi:hypothetical protein